MFDRFYAIVDYLFPVRIIRREDVLSIEDRRPTGEMLLCGILAILLIASSVFLVANTLDAIKFAIPAIAIAAYLVYRTLKQTFREIYVFDKTKDTYWFIRQSVLGKEVIEGSASQFRAAEVLRKSVITGDGTVYLYQAALLQNPGLLLGTDETQILRPLPPIYNSLEVETRIVEAISGFLNITNNDVVDSR